MVLDDLHERILINMRLLRHTNENGCTIDKILSRDYHSHVDAWPEDGLDDALHDLELSGYVNHHGDAFALTRQGEQTALDCLERFFAKTMIDAYHSHAAHEFRERLYGMDLYQYNMATRNQMSTLRTYLNPRPDLELLDLGCGLGGVAEYFSEFGASVRGIDLADDLIESAIIRTQKYRYLDVTFERDDIADYIPKQYYDGIYAIDAVQFLNLSQQKQAVKRLYNSLKPHGIMAILYSQTIPATIKTGKPQILPAESLTLGQALNALDIQFEAVDFCDEYIPFWQRQSQFATELAESFRQEELEQLYHERIQEGTRILREVLSGEHAFGRYLYIIRK